MSSVSYHQDVSSHGHGVSISWVASHRRSSEIAKVAGVEPIYVRDGSKALPLRYLKQILATRRLLAEQSPDVIIVMQPPPLALATVLPYARRSGATVIGDLHSGVFFDPKWAWASRWVLAALRRNGGAIVPNDELAELCRARGVPTFVSHGWITPFQASTVSQTAPAGEFLLVPFTYARDEPIEELLAAARQTPEITWLLTGSAPKSVRAAASTNVVFSGYVSPDEYGALRSACTAMVALTEQPSTMQSAGYEAVASGIPLITVPEQVLVDYFGEHAVYTRLTPAAIAAAARTVVAEQDHWRKQMLALRSLVMNAQGRVADSIQEWIAGRRGRDAGRGVDVDS